MDFNDSPEEAAYRAKAHAWLDANAEPRDPNNPRGGLLDEAEGDAIAQAKAWQLTKQKAGAGPKSSVAKRRLRWNR